MSSFGQEDDVIELGLRGSYARLSMLQGADAVAKMSANHCTKEGRGDAMLNVGWNSPNVNQTYSYAIFALPCPTFDRVDSNWTLHSAPVEATWHGVHQAVKVAYNNTLVSSAWEQLAMNYSFSGGGLGTAGMMNYGNVFLDVCRFGTYASSGCCTPNVTVSSWRAVTEAFSQDGSNSESSGRQYTDPALYRAFLANAVGLNEFFNGDGRTFDGCVGFFSILDSSEYFFPNKHPGRWSDPDDMVTIGEVIAGGSNGFFVTWGSESVCKNARTPCDYDDGTLISQSRCEGRYGRLRKSLASFIFGGGALPC
jgi:hypothetical protein